MNLTVVFLKAMKYTYIFVVLLLHSSNIVVVQGGMTVAMNASCFATDFSKLCPKFSFYSDGNCYHLYTVNISDFANATNAINSCKSFFIPGQQQLAVVRSASVAKNMVHLFRQNYGTVAAGQQFWIGTYDNNPSLYSMLNNTKSRDGNAKLAVGSMSYNICTLLTYRSPSLYTIQAANCSDRHPFFCEINPLFVQKGCNMVLVGNNCPVVHSVTVDTVTACGARCIINGWCTGINYNAAEKLCQLLSINMLHGTMQCNTGWSYFERHILKLNTVNPRFESDSI